MGAPLSLETVVLPSSKGLARYSRELWAYRDLLRHLVGRELKVKYKRSVLGWVWSLANPLLMAGVFTLVFTVAFRVTAPPGHPERLHSYALFLLCALLPWNFTSNALSVGCGAIVGGADLVRKVYFPRAALVFSYVIAILVSFALELGVLLILVLAAGGRPGFALTALPLLIFLQVIFVAGLSMIVAGLNVFFRDLQHLIGILLMIWFYGTPIIYPPNLIPEHTSKLGFDLPLRSILNFNPMARFAEAYRDVIYHARFPSGEALAYLAVVSVAVFILCLAAFRRLEPRFAEEV